MHTFVHLIHLKRCANQQHPPPLPAPAPIPSARINKPPKPCKPPPSTRRTRPRALAPASIISQQLDMAQQQNTRRRGECLGGNTVNHLIYI